MQWGLQTILTIFGPVFGFVVFCGLQFFHNVLAFNFHFLLQKKNYGRSFSDLLFLLVQF